MQPGIIYRLSWNTVETISTNPANNIPPMAMVIDIKDTETLIPDADTPVIISLTPSGSPLVIKIINNDRDKFSPIRAKQAVIQFMSNKAAFQDVTTFSDSSDNRWKVDITADGNPVFYGFLMLPDSSMPFLPDPNLVVLTASDHLGVLKDLPLQTDAGANPSGKFRIAELIALCLKKTGLTLDIVVINNLRHGSGSIQSGAGEVQFVTNTGLAEMVINAADIGFFYPGQQITITGTPTNDGTYTVLSAGALLVGFVFLSGTVNTETAPGIVTFTDTTSAGHFYDKIYLDVKTFEQEIGISEFCYSVLEKILGEDCFLSQWKGKWYIMRVDEYDGNPIYPATFNSDGVFQSFDTPTNFNKSIGAIEVRRFANANQLLEFDRPNNFIKETFRFDYPQEILCNLSLARGTHNATLTTTSYEALNPECWVFEKNYPPIPPPSTGGAILVFTVSGVETARYLHIFASAVNSYLYFRSEDRIPIQVSDKFKFSVDWKYDNNPGGSGHYRYPVAQLRLYGDNGTNWTLNAVAGYNSVDPRTYWIQSNSAWATNNRFLYQEGELNQDDLSQWVTASFESAPAPVTGRLEIFLMHNQNTDARGKDFAALSFDYIPYLQGTYAILKGDYNKVQRSATGFLAKRDKDVFIQDCLKQLFKGALLFRSSTRSIFTGNITFVAPDFFSFDLASGYKNYLFYPGQEITVTGTNAGTYKVVSVFYHIIGDYTDVHVQETFVNAMESVTISEIVYALTTQWYNAALVALGAPALTALHPYGYHQAFSVWNQYRNANRILSGGVLGLGSMWCDALDKVSLTDSNPNTDNRYFMLISFEQNWKTALWSGVFIEDYRTDIGKIYTDTEEFKYLTK